MLKGVGLRMEDALAFWKAEFSQKVNTVYNGAIFGYPLLRGKNHYFLIIFVNCK